MFLERLKFSALTYCSLIGLEVKWIPSWANLKGRLNRLDFGTVYSTLSLMFLILVQLQIITNITQNQCCHFKYKGTTICRWGGFYRNAISLTSTLMSHLSMPRIFIF